MLQTSFIRQNKEQVLEGLAKRNFKDAEANDRKSASVGRYPQGYAEHFGQQSGELNSLAKEIGDMFKSGRAGEAAAAEGENGSAQVSVEGTRRKALGY